MRATAWELAAFSFRHPTHELARAITSGEWFDAACEIGDALGVILPEDFGKGLPSPSSSIENVDEDGFFHRLRAEATRLFMGPGGPACSPYEGVWRAKAEGVKPLLFVNPHSVEVERFVKDHGFTRPEGTNEPLDHVATECELLQAFAMRRWQIQGRPRRTCNFLKSIYVYGLMIFALSVKTKRASRSIRLRPSISKRLPNTNYISRFSLFGM